jgi:hypothetical protein
MVPHCSAVLTSISDPRQFYMYPNPAKKRAMVIKMAGLSDSILEFMRNFSGKS